MIKVICYGTETVYKEEERKKLIKEFKTAVLVCRGSEQGRYANILSDLICGKEVCTDEEVTVL